jgi:ribosomal protein S18 acetylase RimI-like enzyme
MIEISIGFPEAQRAVAARLYDEAFHRKLAPMVPDAVRRQAMLAECLDPERALVAMEADRVIGLAGFHHDGRSLTGAGGWSTLMSHLGLWGALRAAAGFALFERSPQPGELLMDGICVASEARGRGVGTTLLRGIFDHAALVGVDHVRLDVIDTNPRARALYEREGFIAAETTEVGWLSGTFGFSSATTMVKTLS